MDILSNKGKFNIFAFIFNVSYYAGYGKVGKAILLGIIGIVPLLLAIILKIGGLIFLIMLPVAIYMGFAANKELPIGEKPFHWGKAVGVGLLQFVFFLFLPKIVKIVGVMIQHN